MSFPSFTIRGHLAQCWLFVYRTPVEAIAGLLPRQFSAVTKGGFAFWNIVVCRLENMRPSLLPAELGLGYWHIAYRLHVCAERETGGALEGLFFVRSDCDRKLMEVAGNRLTDFHFHHAKVRVSENSTGVCGTIVSADAAATFEIDRTIEPQLTAGSPYDSLDAAAQALEYKPAALSAHGENAVRVVAVRRDATAWRWKTVRVANAHWQFLDGRDAALELCYEVEPVDYLWERQNIVRVKPCTS